MQRITHRLAATMLLASAAMLPAVAQAQGLAKTPPGPGYVASSLVANLAGQAPWTDKLLVNPWGVAFVPGSAFWINDNGSGVSTLYNGQGDPVPVSFVIPPPAGKPGPSAPTGMVWNPTGKFIVPGTTLPALFIFDTEDGTLSAWAPNLPSNPKDAVLAVDNSASGAVYKGLEFGANATGVFLFATNFHAGTIDVFDSSFKPATSSGGFSDANLPAGYAPFGIKNIDGNLVVTYAKQNAQKHDDVPGAGHGYVDVFDTDGNLLRRLWSGEPLNSPWAIAQAPDGFGPLGNTLLIGNFGNGKINAFSLNGRYMGGMKTPTGTLLAIPGLWALTFGGASASAPGTLFFTAGPNQEQNGRFGSISFVLAPAAP